MVVQIEIEFMKFPYRDFAPVAQAQSLSQTRSTPGAPQIDSQKGGILSSHIPELAVRKNSKNPTLYKRCFVQWAVAIHTNVLKEYVTSQCGNLEFHESKLSRCKASKFHTANKGVSNQKKRCERWIHPCSMACMEKTWTC